MKTSEIIKNLINLVGVTAGIIITSIGSIMLINSFLKLYVFGIEKDSYHDSQWQCSKYDIEEKAIDHMLHPEVEKENPVHLSNEQKEKLEKKHVECLKKEDTKAVVKYLSMKKEDMADGLAFLIVGIPILLFYQRRRSQ